jgi:hypothetical protein
MLGTGGPFNATWNLPAGLAAESFDIERYYSDGSFDVAEASVLPTSTTATVQLMPPTGTVSAGILDTVAADFYNRNYSFRMWLP